MIKLEDLKVGDKIYKICKYHWLQEIEIMEGKREFEYQETSKPTIFVVIGKSLNDWGKQREQFFHYDEKNIFRTEHEARQKMNEYRNVQKEELLNKDKLIEFLFNKSETIFTLPEKQLIKEIIKENKLNNI